MAVTACLPVYRTYIRDEHISATDRAYIEDALTVAGKGPALEFLRRVLLLSPPWYIQASRGKYLDFVMRWQQFTGPVMAKGLEDTAFYVHNPLVSVNEVGGDCYGPEVYFGVEEVSPAKLEAAFMPPALDECQFDARHETKRRHSCADQRPV